MTRRCSPASFAPPVLPPDGDAGALVGHHRYQLAARHRQLLPGQVVARFSAMALRRPLKVEKVWYDLRNSGELLARHGDLAHGTLDSGPTTGKRLPSQPMLLSSSRPEPVTATRYA